MRARTSKVHRTGVDSHGKLLARIALGFVLVPTACLSPTTSYYTSSGQALSVNPAGAGGTTTTTSSCQSPASGTFALCDATAQTLNLGVSRAFNLTLKAASDYTGDVTLTIDRTNLDTIDTKARVGTELSMAAVHLTPGMSASIPVMVTTNTQAHDFSSDFKVVASDGGGTTSSANVPLQVQPIYDVYLHGGKSPETWDAPAAGSTTMFAPHAAGLTINYWNMDTASSHIIHGAGVVPHQDTATPLQPSAGNGVAGGVYTIHLTGKTQQTGFYYCHVHESSADARNVQTNTP